MDEAVAFLVSAAVIAIGALVFVAGIILLMIGLAPLEDFIQRALGKHAIPIVMTTALLGFLALGAVLAGRFSGWLTGELDLDAGAAKTGGLFALCAVVVWLTVSAWRNRRWLRRHRVRRKAE